MFLRGLGVYGDVLGVVSGFVEGLYKPLNLYRITSVLLCRRIFGYEVWGVGVWLR